MRITIHTISVFCEVMALGSVFILFVLIKFSRRKNGGNFARTHALFFGAKISQPEQYACPRKLLPVCYCLFRLVHLLC